MNKLHPQELADLLQRWVAMDKDKEWFIYDTRPSESDCEKWLCNDDYLNVTHAIAKPDDCPEWDKVIWEPRKQIERGQLCLFANDAQLLTIPCATIGYFDSIRHDGKYLMLGLINGFEHCKPIDGVPPRIDLDAQRSDDCKQ